MKNSPKDIQESIKNSNKIVLMGHRDGDGDFYGAAFGLKIGLESIGKSVDIITNEAIPTALEFLYSYFNGTLSEQLDENADLLVILDTSDKARTVLPHVFNFYKDKKTKIILIDHHTKGDLYKISDVAWSDSTFCSVSEMIYYLLKDLDININKNIATCLLTGIETDTSSFQNQNTTKECFFVASELMGKGARLKAIINNTFGGKPIDILKIWGLAIDRIHLSKKFNAIISYLTFEDIKQHGISGEALSGIANFLNSIKGAKILIFLTEEEKGIIRVSMRTRNDKVDVSVLAKLLGGGGHAKASGFTVKGHIETTDGSAAIIK